MPYYNALRCIIQRCVLPICMYVFTFVYVPAVFMCTSGSVHLWHNQDQGGATMHNALPGPTEAQTDHEYDLCADPQVNNKLRTQGTVHICVKCLPCI